MKNSPPQAIIFDLDGTLWDSADTIAHAWNEGAADLRLKGYYFTGDTVRSIAGLKRDEIFARIFRKERPELIPAISEYFEPLENKWLSHKGGLLYPGVKAVLHRLHLMAPLFLISNCESRYLQLFLQFSGFGPYFSGTDCFGNRGIPKALNTRLMLNAHKLESACFVGDTTSDWHAARSNRLTFIHAGYGFGNVPDQDMVIENISQLNRFF